MYASWEQQWHMSASVNRNCCPHCSGCEKRDLLGCNTVHFLNSPLTFRRNISLQSSGSKNNLRKEPTWSFRNCSLFHLLNAAFYIPYSSTMKMKWLVSLYSDELRVGRPGFDYRQRQDLVLYNVKPPLVPTQPPIQRVPCAISSEIKRPGREADHSPPSSAEVKCGGTVPPLPHTASFRSAWLIKHRDNFTFMVLQPCRRFCSSVVIHSTDECKRVLEPSSRIKTSLQQMFHNNFALNFLCITQDILKLYRQQEFNLDFRHHLSQWDNVIHICAL
jgi:hypothetical protein